MTIILATNELILGGATILLWRWAEILRDAGHKVIIIGAPGPFARRLKQSDFWVQEFPCLDYGGRLPTGEVISLLRALDPDRFVAMHFRSQLIAPYVVEKPHFYNVGPFQMRWDSVIAEASRDGRLATTQGGLADLFVEVYGSSEVSIIPIAAWGFEYVAPSALGEPVVGTVTRFASDKSYLVGQLVDACAALDLRLDIMGEGSKQQESEVGSWVQKVGPKVRLRQSQYPAPYHEWDIFVGTSTTVLEAALSGVPTIVGNIEPLWTAWGHKVDNLGEAVGILGGEEPDISGHLLREYRPDSFENYLQEILAMDTADRILLTHKASEAVKAKHGRQTMSRLIEGFLGLE